MKTIIVDYGVGNLLSVSRAFEKVGVSPIVSRDPRDISGADRLVLPGVGAFGKGIEKISEMGLQDPLKEFHSKKRPLLGICLGMQPMFDESEEFGRHEGLGFVEGKVLKIEGSSGNIKTPVVGWAKVDGINLGPLNHPMFYFVHSYQAVVSDKKAFVASYDYCGLSITAFVQKENLMGCQSHPEKSGDAGLKFLSLFLNL